jgi:hypothetical protein
MRQLSSWATFSGCRKCCFPAGRLCDASMREIVARLDTWSSCQPRQTLEALQRQASQASHATHLHLPPQPHTCTACIQRKQEAEVEGKQEGKQEWQQEKSGSKRRVAAREEWQQEPEPTAKRGREPRGGGQREAREARGGAQASYPHHASSTSQREREREGEGEREREGDQSWSRSCSVPCCRGASSRGKGTLAAFWHRRCIPGPPSRSTCCGSLRRSRGEAAL